MNGAERPDALYERKKERRAARREQLDEDAPDAPDVAGVVPAEAEDHLGGAVVARGHHGGVVLVLERGAPKVDQADLAAARDALGAEL